MTTIAEFSPSRTLDDVARHVEQHRLAADAYTGKGVWIHRCTQPEIDSQLTRLAGLMAEKRDLPLMGLTVAVKDNIDVAGMPTTAACPAFSYVPQVSAAVVQKLCDAVAIVVSAVLAWTWQRIRPEFLREHDVEVAVGTYIRTHSSPDDRLFVWGNASEIYYFANRVMGTRFAFCNYHAGKIWGSWSYAVDAGDTSMFVVPRAWTELLEDLDRAPPAFIVDSAAGGIANFDRHPIGRYEELARRVARNYRLETVVDGVPIYRRQAH